MKKFFTHLVLGLALGFALVPSKSSAQIYFQEDFDGLPGPVAGGIGTYSFPAGWLLRDSDAQVAFFFGFTNGWTRGEDIFINILDSAAYSTSWYSPIPGISDDWMWTPPTLIQQNTTLSWNGLAGDPLYPDGYQVRIMSQAVTPGGPTGGTGVLGNQVTNSTLLLNIPAENPAWTPRSLNLSAYWGQTVWIAFRNNSNDQFLLLIDDVTLTACPTTAQPGAISGSATICSGTTNTYSVTAVPGATSYTWTLPGGWSGTSTTNSINATAGATGGTITVVANNACGASTPQTLLVTVNTVPATPGAISGTTPVCAGSTNTYSIVAVPGATSYSWTLPGTWSGSSTTTSINATAGAAGGSITVTATNTCGTSAAQTLPVSITPIPAQPGAISGNITVCQSSSNTYTVVAVPGATSYTWTLPAGWAGSSTSNSINATAGGLSGNITVTANNLCGSSTPATLPVTVLPVPATPGLISGNNPICAGTTNTYSIVAVPGAVSYTWTLPASWSGASTTNSINATATALGGNISVTANNACGSSFPSTLLITVVSAPVQPAAISGSDTICAGTTNTYSVTSDPLAVSYIWTLPLGWTGSSSTNSISATANNMGGTLTVIAVNPCGNSPVQSMNVTIDTIPGQPTMLSGILTPCENAPETYSTPLVAGATSYTWTLPPGWTGSSTTNSINVVVGSSGGNLSVTADNACGSSAPFTATIIVNPVPPAPSGISGNDTVCAGSTDTFFIAAVAGATGYTWTLPPGWTGSSITDSISAVVGATSGYVTVTANNICGASIADSLFVTVITTPVQPGSISGDSAVCAGSTNSYSIALVPDASGYIWTLPASWSGSSFTNTINATAGASGGVISVVAVNACGVSSPQTFTVGLNSAPTAQYNSSSVSLVATFNNVSFNNPVSYLWDFGDLNTSTAINPNHTYASGGIYTVCLIATNPCGSDTICDTVTVCELPSAVFSNSMNNLSSTFTDLSGGSPVSWSWDFGDGGTSALQNPVHNYPGQGSYTVCLITSNSCGVDTSCSNITIVCAIPVANYFYSALANQVVFTNTGSAGPGISYFWDFGDGTNSTLQNPVHTYAASGIYNGCLIVNGGCGADTLCVDVVVDCLAPVAGFSASGTISLMNFIDQSLNSPTSWLWNFGDGSTSTQQNPNHVYAGAGQYNVCLVASNQCGSTTICQLVNAFITSVYPDAFSNLEVYPNPATDFVTLNADFNSNAPVSIRLMDMFGKVVMETSQVPDAHHVQINLSTSELAAGVYLVTVEQEGNSAQVRLVVE